MHIFLHSQFLQFSIAFQFSAYLSISISSMAMNFVARQLWQRRNSLNYTVRLVHYYAATPATELRRPLFGFNFPATLSRRSKCYDQLSPSLHNFLIVSAFTTHAVIVHPVGGTVDVPLAQTGEGIAECELLKWFVQEGDQVEEFQPLCEVQSDKATIEITSRYKGKISHILHAPGEIVKVGETLLQMIVEEISPMDLSDEMSETKTDMPGSQGDLASEFSLITENISSRVLCTPAVRNLAKQLGVDVNDIKGSGEAGRILEVDVLEFLGEKDVRASASFESSSKSIVDRFNYEDKTLQLRGFQRAMVKSMTMAARIPHFHFVEEVNCDALVDLKSSFQRDNLDPSIKHTFLPILVKSLSMALSKYPLLNGSFSEDTLEVTLKGSHNIGIAMATPYGLVVPNIKKVQSLSILEITKEISRLQQLAMDNKLSQGDITGGTITISNIGAIGGKFGSPLINIPEVAIIAIGRIQKVPHITDKGDVYPMPVMNVNIGADHRVLDGATVAKFCTEWKSLIEKPELLLLHMR